MFQYYLSFVFCYSTHLTKVYKMKFEITKTQDYFRLTLFRYLSSKMSQSGAIMKMEQIENILHTLIFTPLKNFES